MKFEEIIPALRAGKKVKRKRWNDVYLHINSSGLCELSGRNVDHTLMYFKISSLLENDDWEIIEDKKIVKLRDLTEEQYVKWKENNCCANLGCDSCPFKYINCDIGRNNYKEMYSDEFLEQEIEIEED